MRGTITTEEKCPICGAKMVDNRRNAVACRDHPSQIARKLRVVFKKDGKLTRRKFSRDSGLRSYMEAQRFLIHLQVEVDEGSFDARDYQGSKPLGFVNQMEQFLRVKEETLKPASFRPVKLYAKYAVTVWGNRNVKTIGYAEIEDFLTFTLKHLSSKSRSNAKSVLHDFFSWLVHRRVLSRDQMPEFPVIKVKMDYRPIVDKATQGAILSKLYELTWDTNPRIWIFVKWLSVYCVRPGELLSVRERDVDLNLGCLIIQPEHDKVGRGKVYRMRTKDLEVARSLPRGFPEMPFFRHLPGAVDRAKRMVAGKAFRHDYVSAWWDRACEGVGVSGVSLYPGTKHSTICALSAKYGPDWIMGAVHISSNKAFERYLVQLDPEIVRSIYADAGGDFEGPLGGKVGKVPLLVPPGGAKPLSGV